jgi:hypothetical protein
MTFMSLNGFMVVILKIILNDELENTWKELSLYYTKCILKCIWRHWIKDTMNLDGTVGLGQTVQIERSGTRNRS